MGGAICAIENNFQQNKIADSAYEYQKSIENDNQIVVGLNKFKEPNKKANQAILEIDQKSIDLQLSRLNEFKKKRSKLNVLKHLDKLSAAIKNDENLIPHIVDCIKNNCTLGDICETMKNYYGEF